MIRLAITVALGPSVAIASALDRAVGIRCPVVTWWARYLGMDRT